jgi:hypothetical protein
MTCWSVSSIAVVLIETALTTSLAHRSGSGGTRSSVPACEAAAKEPPCKPESPVSLGFMTVGFAQATECQRVDRRSPVRLTFPSDSRPLSTLST